MVPLRFLTISLLTLWLSNMYLLEANAELLFPKASTSSGGGRSADEVVDEIANDMIGKLPPNFNIDFANKKYPVGEHESTHSGWKSHEIDALSSGSCHSLVRSHCRFACFARALRSARSFARSRIHSLKRLRGN